MDEWHSLVSLLWPRLPLIVWLSLLIGLMIVYRSGIGIRSLLLPDFGCCRATPRLSFLKHKQHKQTREQLCKCYSSSRVYALDLRHSSDMLFLSLKDWRRGKEKCTFPCEDTPVVPSPTSAYTQRRAYLAAESAAPLLACSCRQLRPPRLGLLQWWPAGEKRGRSPDFCARDTHTDKWT